MQNLKILLSSIAVAAISVPAVALGQADENPDQSASGYGYDRFAHKRGKIQERMMQRVDTNQDGKLDINEFMSHSEQRFNSLDIDSDGYITPEETKQASKEMRKKHREMRLKMLEEQAAQDEEADGS